MHLEIEACLKNENAGEESIIVKSCVYDVTKPEVSQEESETNKFKRECDTTEP